MDLTSPRCPPVRMTLGDLSGGPRQASRDRYRPALGQVKKRHCGASVPSTIRSHRATQAMALSCSLMNRLAAMPYAWASRCAAAALSPVPAAERLAAAWARSRGRRRATQDSSQAHRSYEAGRATRDLARDLDLARALARDLDLTRVFDRALVLVGRLTDRVAR